MRSLVVLSLLVATPAFASGPVTAGFARSYADPDRTGPIAPLDILDWAVDGRLLSSTSDLGPGAMTTAAAQSTAWMNHLSIGSDITRGWGFSAARTAFVINQTVNGQPGSIAHIVYTIGVDGAFTPGLSANYIPQPYLVPQYVQYLTGAFLGTAYGYSFHTDAYGTDIQFDASNGSISFGRTSSHPGYINTLTGLLQLEQLCDPNALNSRCADGGVFADRIKLSFDVPVGQNFWIFSDINVVTNGQADFFHTAKLISISLAPEFDLVSDDGGVLVRNPYGIFLSVPEPATWSLFIAGFGIAGSALRRNRTQAAA